MDLYEHQGKELLGRFGIATGRGRVAHSVDEARLAAAALGATKLVVKAQVLSGGRGKAGGVRVVQGPDAVADAAGAILGLDINGHVTRRIWIEQAVAIRKEYYLAVTLDRNARMPLVMLSTMGGMDIEAVASTHPTALARVLLDPGIGPRPFFIRRVLYSASVPDAEHEALGGVIEHLVRAFNDLDALLVEVNPLVLTEDGTFVAADAKITIDDASLYRHPDVADMRDTEADDPLEQMAHQRHLTYVKLDGTIGILGNGAGLVMSTLDVVAQVGGSAANFLDVGGGADADRIVDALEVIVADQRVRAILFNIFGGITRCDEVARGVLEALERLRITLPIVVRLDGTNDAEGRALISQAQAPNIIAERTMLDAARRVVELARVA